MRVSKANIDDKTLLINEPKTIKSPISSRLQNDYHSSIQRHLIQQDHMSNSKNKSSPSSDYIYSKIVKAIGNNEYIDEKRFLKRASWSPAINQEIGLPPTGKRIDIEPLPTNKNINRIRIRPKVVRYFQPPPPQQLHSHHMLLGRPLSFNEKYDRCSIDKQQGSNPNLFINSNGNFLRQRNEFSSSPLSSSVDTQVQMTIRRSPSFDNSELISDTSTASSITTTTTTTNTITSVSSMAPSYSCRRTSSNVEHNHSSAVRPLLNEYQHSNLARTDFKSSSPLNFISSSSSISSSLSIPTSMSSLIRHSNGHEHSSSSSNGSSLDPHKEFTMQTLTADTSRDNVGPSTKITTRSIMTMSMSPNRHHNQTRSAKAIITSSQMSPATNVTIMTNNGDGLKQHKQRDQTESASGFNYNGCLKLPTTTNNNNSNNNNNNNSNNNNRIKKSVHFDWHMPKEIRPRSPSPVSEDCNSNCQQTVTIASSSSLSNGSSNSGDNDKQKKLCDDQRAIETLKEKEKIETTTRTITTNPLTTTTTTSTILRSFSLSPSPLSKEENNDSRPYREEKKENVDEQNCTTTTQRVTTAAAHLHPTTTTATVTFNDGSNSVSQKRESNGTNNSNTNLLKRQSLSSFEKSMPLNSLLVKTSSLNTIINPHSPQQSSSSSSATSTAKRLISNGFFNFIGRSNSSNNKSSASTDENKQLRRTSSTQLRAQRKAKQQTTLTTGTNGNKRLSADVESLLPPSSINSNHCEISKEDIHAFDKVTTNHNNERQSSISLGLTSADNNNNHNNIHATSSSNIESTIPLCTNTNINNSSLSMQSNSTTKIIKSDEGDSLNNGFLFRPVTDPKCDYILHDHQTAMKEPFFLSSSKSMPIRDESTTTQTSTLIISTPSQYHYFLYPPNNNTTNLSSSSPPSSSSSSSSSSSAKSSSKNYPKLIATANRTISNVSINSVSTNSSSSCRSYESHTQDSEYLQSNHMPLNAEDETITNSTSSITNNTNNDKIHKKKVIQSALIDWKMKSSSEISNDSITKMKPVILSDSVQAFWPPPPSPPTLDINNGLATTTVTTERTKQSESTPIKHNMTSSNSLNDSMNVNHTDIISTKEDIGSYSEQHTFTNGCLRNASDTSLEDTQASYTERLREKSRSIPMNANNDMHSYLNRSISKDEMHDYHIRSKTYLNTPEPPLAHESLSRPKSIGQQTRTAHMITKQQTENLEHDFQTKRDFFENRIYADNASTNTSLSSISTNILPTKPKVYTLSPSNPQMNNNLLQHTTINNNSPRNVTRRSWNDLSFKQQSPPTSSLSSNLCFEPPSTQPSCPPPPAIRKPIRIVKAIQQSPSPINEIVSTSRPLTTPKTYSLAKPGLFSASPINSYQKIPNKILNSTRRFQSRDENDLQFHLKEFLSRFPHHHSLNETERLTLLSEHHLSTDYTRALFPIPDRLRRIRSRQSSGGDTSSITTSSNSSSDYIHRTVSNDSCIFDDDASRQLEDLLMILKKRRQTLKENQRTISEEIDDNKILGTKLLNIIESSGESSEIEKFKLHIDEIDTITSILLKLSSRLAKVENDLLMLPNTNEPSKESLIERREKAQQKYDEAKSLKDGIDRRSRLVTNILRKYFSNEQFDDYEHFIRMKSTLLMDAKDLEENVLIIEKQIEILNRLLLSDFQNFQTSNNDENLPANSYKTVSSMA